MEKKYLNIGKRLKILRGKRTQTQFADRLGTSLRAYQHYEAGEREPDIDLLNTLSRECTVTIDWILKGPAEIKYQENHNSLNSVILSDNIQNPYPVASQSGSNDAGIEPSLQAMSDIKEIFDSGDPILIPAIQANLNAFKRALLRERQIAQVLEENKNLIFRMAKLENLCKSLKVQVNRLTATYEDSGEGSKDCSNHDAKK